LPFRPWEPPPPAAEFLPSWNNTAAKKAIVSFVEKVTGEGSADRVPVAERIAVFDNDGTLWSEQPLYFQTFFILDRITALAPQHPEWKDKEPFASVLKGDVKTALAGGEKALMEMAMATHAGMTTDEFETIVTDWITTAKHPKTGRLFTEMVYQPMLELLAYLRANSFKTFIVSGGGIEFMRPWAERVYGIPPEQVLGSSIKTKFEVRDGKPVLVRLPELNFLDDKEGKPVGINSHIGRRPIAAVGNSDGDLQMLQWTSAGAGARFCLCVHHSDAEREWAYDRDSHIGRLDKGLDEAKTRNWTVVDMKRDWKRVFPFEAPLSALRNRSACFPSWRSAPALRSVLKEIMNQSIAWVFFVGGLFAGVLVFLHIGRTLGRRRLASEGEDGLAGLGAIDASVYGLMGLLIAFTFSGAANRFNDRQGLIIDEVNAIGTAWLRLDLLEAGTREEVRDLFRRYVEMRLATYRNPVDRKGLAELQKQTAALEGELWARRHHGPIVARSRWWCPEQELIVAVSLTISRMART
jgi:phosphoserine phosphatase